MKKEWPKVSLGELLRLERRPVKVRTDTQYQEIGIYCFGRGIFHKTPRTGFEIGAKDLFLLKEGDFILQVTFAWEGAIAIVSAAEDGMYGSTRYPTFRVDETRCVPQFLLQYFKTDDGIRQLINICPGSAGRNRVLSIKRIPEVLVPLPPLEEQRRLVICTADLTTEIREANLLREQAVEQVDALLRSSLERLFPERGVESHYRPLRDTIESHKQGFYSTTKPLEGEVLLARISDITDDNFLSYETMPRISVDEKVLESFCVSPNDFLFARTGGAGRFAQATEKRDCIFASYLIRFRFNAGYLPDFLRFYFQSPRFQNAICSRIHGGANQNVHAEDIKRAYVPVLPIAEQRRIVSELAELQTEVNVLKQLQAETDVELNALMPSILSRAFRGEL